MILRILGSAAGGGFPQWNCACGNCNGLRKGLIVAVPRTQESSCLSADGHEWFLINASPDIRAQIESFTSLHPASGRATPINAIFLTNGDLDHCLGLLSLRESQPLVIYATDAVRRGFVDGNVLYRTLERFPGHVTWRTLTLGQEEAVTCANGAPSGLTATAFAVPGKPPVHLDGMVARENPELNVGLRFNQIGSGRVLAYLPSVGCISSSVLNGLAGVDGIIFDGTFWSSDELSMPGFLRKSAEELAHWPVGGMDGSLARLAGIRARYRIFIHINNTNPMLREDAAERTMVESAGWQVARDGMEIHI
jgi:pyrroloquinoline quinone biosynthesis protein B